MMVFFLFISMSRPALGPAHPPIQWVMEALPQGIKWLGCEVDHLPPSSAKVKSAWSNTSTSPICRHDVVLN